MLRAVLPDPHVQDIPLRTHDVRNKARLSPFAFEKAAHALYFFKQHSQLELRIGRLGKRSHEGFSTTRYHEVRENSG